jgi:hypothetical protein
MYKYSVRVKKVSGRLNESVLPNKNLTVKSKSKKTDKEVFAEASKYFMEKYGLVIESAEVTLESSGDEPYIHKMAQQLRDRHLWLYNMPKNGGEPLVNKIEAFSYKNTSGNPVNGSITIRVNGKTASYSVQKCSISQVADESCIFVPYAPAGYYNAAIITAPIAKAKGVNVSSEEETGKPKTVTGFYY